MAVAPNGDVVPCQSWLSEDSLGNLLNEKFSSIWKSKKCKLIRKNSMKINNLCPLTQKNKKVK
jgi:radical SAM protein with 4Fe4S-binding SPASM domain